MIVKIFTVWGKKNKKEQKKPHQKPLSFWCKDLAGQKYIIVRGILIKYPQSLIALDMKKKYSETHAFIKSCTILKFSVLYFEYFHSFKPRIQQPKCLISEDFGNVTMLLKCKRSDLFAVAPSKIYYSSKGHSKHRVAVLLKP